MCWKCLQWETIQNVTAQKLLAALWLQSIRPFRSTLAISHIKPLPCAELRLRVSAVLDKKLLLLPIALCGEEVVTTAEFQITEQQLIKYFRDFYASFSMSYQREKIAWRYQR